MDVSTILKHDAHTGIQRVVKAVCKELRDQPWPGISVFPAAADKSSPYRVVATPLLAADGDFGPGPLELKAGDLFLGLDLAAQTLNRYEWQVRGWRRNGARLAAVVYDLLPVLRPDWFNPRLVRNFSKWIALLGRQADIILPISHSVSHDVQRYLSANQPSRMGEIAVHVLPLSGDLGQFVTGARMPVHDPVVAAMLQRPSILMVGTIEPRKGHAVALARHRENWAARPDAPLLVMAGQGGWKTERLQAELARLALADDGVVWLGKVSDEQLDRFYRACAGVLVASYGEGYCLPLHEALAYGKPALARDLPVLRELEAPGIRYFSNESPAELGSKMLALVSETGGSPLRPCTRGWGESLAVLERALLGTNRAEQDGIALPTRQALP